MKTATIHQAKTHLSQLIRAALSGETVIIMKGTVPVAKLVAISEAHSQRPKVGTVTSAPVGYDETTFAPMTPGELEEWGL